MFLELRWETWAALVVGVVIWTVIFVRDRRKGLPQYAPATTRQKVVVLLLLATTVAAWTIYLAGWSLFGGFEKQVAGVVSLICLGYTVRLRAILERS